MRVIISKEEFKDLAKRYEHFFGHKPKSKKEVEYWLKDLANADVEGLQETTEEDN